MNWYLKINSNFQMILTECIKNGKSAVKNVSTEFQPKKLMISKLYVFSWLLYNKNYLPFSFGKLIN